jgi:dTDP-4-dehydrorhamnose 3,5-epimerase-like enzyme
MVIDNCILLDFPKIIDARGNLTFIENSIHIPFDIKRVYYLYDVPDGSERGGHAHRDLNQILIALSGSFDVLLSDGINEKKVHLNSQNVGLLIVPMVWREIINFTENAICLVLASDIYKEEDYYRDFDEFCSDIK